MNPASPSLFTFWRELLVLAAAYGVVMGVVAKAVLDAQFMGAFDRCKDRIMARINEWYGDRIQRIDGKLSLVDVHEDRLTGFEESLLQQGRALSEKLSEHFTSNTQAMQTVTSTLVALQKEAAATALAVARIEGRMEGGEWDGVNRRRKTRRKPALGDST